MQYVEGNILCLEADEFIDKIVPKGTYDSLKSRGNITVHGIGGQGRTVLIEFETMPKAYKEKVRELYNDPYEYAAKQPLLNAINADPKAVAFYTSYVLPTGDKLPNSDLDAKGKSQINYVARYVENAEWLNMIGRLTADKLTLKKELNINMASFWQTVCLLIKARNVALPGNAKRLKGKLADYQAGGYESLVETHKFGNSNAAKVADDTAEAVLLTMIEQGHDDTIVAAGYNVWAKENGREPIVAGTVGYHRKKHKAASMFKRQGLGVVSSTLSKTIKRARPTAPLLLVNSDDNVLDVFFDNHGKLYDRPKLYVVIDAFNDYILGYAWGEVITKELIKKALYNAHRHIMELTGNAFLWHQIQTDRYAVPVKGDNDLTLYYKAQGLTSWTPAAHKNAAAKYIERAFGTTWHQHLRILFGSAYSGHNITAKKRINPDLLDPKSFPSITQADAMIEAFINTLRHSKRTGSELTRQQEWLESLAASDKARELSLSPELRLDIFGTNHGHLNTITAEGVTPTLLGQEHCYELTQSQILKHIGKQVQVKYDPADLSEVLITDGKGLREVVREFALVPSNFADYREGDAERIKALQNEKRTLLPTIQAEINQRRELLEREGIDAESRLKAGLLLKTQNHEDQRVFMETTYRTHGLPAAKTTSEQGGVRAENDELDTDFEQGQEHQKARKRAVNDDFQLYESM